MASTMPTWTVLEGLAVADRQRVEEPDLNEVQRIRSRSMANHLFSKISAEEKQDTPVLWSL